jgi:N-acetylmuramoyl-L-alanine amidase
MSKLECILLESIGKPDNIVNYYLEALNMKNVILIGIGTLVCLFIFNTTVYADSGQLYQVDSEALELREVPDQNTAVLAELENGEAVTIFEESDGWGKTFYDGKEAWAAINQLAAVNDARAKQAEAEHLDLQGQQSQAAVTSKTDKETGELAGSGKRYRVHAPAVRLRNAPNENAVIITELQNGEEVTIFEESYGWGRTFYNGQAVWIALYLLDEKYESEDSLIPGENENFVQQQTQNETKREEIETEFGQKGEKGEKLEVDSDGIDEAEEEPEVDADEKGEEENPTAEPNETGDEESAVAEPNETDDEEETAEDTNNKEANPDAEKNPTHKKTLSGYHFVIDPGHGGKDPGTIGTKVDEKTLTLSIAKKLEAQLHDQGASVTLTRTDDTFIPLAKRVQTSNSENADAFISLHYNAFEDKSVRGIHTFYYGGNENRKLADSIHKSLINYTNLIDRGAKQADFQVLRENKQPSLLIELGFISNPEEQKLVQTNKYQEEAAKGIVAGLDDYFK